MEKLEMRDHTMLAYETVGEGRPIIFLHGWAGTAHQYWGRIMPIVAAAGYECIGIDQRGSGEATKSITRPVTQELMIDDVRYFMETLNLRNVTLVGSSQGGAIINGYVEKYGCDDGYLHSAVLVDISPRMCMDDDDPSYICGQWKGKWVLSEAIAGVEEIKNNFDGFFRDFIMGIDPDIRALPEDKKQAAIDAYCESIDKGELVEEWYSDLLVDYRSCLGKYTVPLAYFYAGGPDCSFPVETADFYRERVSGPYVSVNFNDNNHLFFIDRYEEFSEELKKFLAAYAE